MQRVQDAGQIYPSTEKTMSDPHFSHLGVKQPHQWTRIQTALLSRGHVHSRTTGRHFVTDRAH